MDFIDVWICFDDRQEGFFHSKVNLRAGQLLLEAAHHGRGQHDVADGTEPYDEDLWQRAFFAKIRFQL